MTYEGFKLRRAMIETAMEPLSDYLKAQPKGPMGLTPDAIKATPEWQQNFKAFHALFAQLRNLNAYGNKHFKSEIRAESIARRRYA